MKRVPLPVHDLEEVRMTTEEKIARRKQSLLELAQER